jgi:hypothetical protein
LISLFLWERHLVTAVAFSEGWLPRFYRGWKPLPQRTSFLSDKVAPGAMTRQPMRNIIGAYVHCVIPAIFKIAGMTKGGACRNNDIGISKPKWPMANFDS